MTTKILFIGLGAILLTSNFAWANARHIQKPIEFVESTRVDLPAYAQSIPGVRGATGGKKDKLYVSPLDTAINGENGGKPAAPFTFTSVPFSGLQQGSTAEPTKSQPSSEAQPMAPTGGATGGELGNEKKEEDPEVAAAKDAAQRAEEEAEAARGETQRTRRAVERLARNLSDKTDVPIITDIRRLIENPGEDKAKAAEEVALLIGTLGPAGLGKLDKMLSDEKSTFLDQFADLTNAPGAGDKLFNALGSIQGLNSATRLVSSKRAPKTATDGDKPQGEGPKL